MSTSPHRLAPGLQPFPTGPKDFRYLGLLVALMAGLLAELLGLLVELLELLAELLGLLVELLGVLAELPGLLRVIAV